MAFTEIAFSDLELFETLNSGSIKSTYRGRWKSKGTIVAVKRMPFMETREVEILSSLNHQNIVQFLGVTVMKPDSYLVAEFAEQGSLYECLKKHVMDFHKVLLWARQIALGMDQLHYNGPYPLIHECLDSEHVVIGGDLTAKICVWHIFAFSIGTVLKSTKEVSHLTPPEVIQQQPMTPATDVFTYGGILWELLTQEVFFKGFSLYETVLLITEKVFWRPCIPSSCPPQFARLMKMCWKQEPKERPDFKQILDVLDGMLDSDLLREETDSFLQNKSQWKHEIDADLAQLKSSWRFDKLLNKIASKSLQERKELSMLEQQSLDQNQRSSKPRSLKDFTAYEEALRMGACNVKYGRVLLLGAAKAGKTSLTRGLMNVLFQKDQGRTIVADVHTVKPVTCTWAKAGESYWESVNKEDEIEELAHLMAVVKPCEEVAKTAMSLSAAELFSSADAPQIQQVVDTKEEKEARSRKRTVVVEEAVVQAKLITEPKVESDVLLHLWDCGGQPVFLDVLPIFLTSRTMFLFVFDASKELSTNEEVHAMRKQAKKVPIDDIITLDLVEQWMAMIYCQLAVKCEKSDVPLRYPQIYPIGTHGDQLSQHERKDVQGKLISHCDAKYYSAILRKPPLIVDNTKAGKGKREDPGFQQIRNAVSEMVTQELQLETPVAWVFFRLLLSKLGRKIVTYAEASKLAMDCGISEEDCPSVLNFYHELGVFLFYSHISSLQDRVIIDPKWLVERLGRLLRLERSPGLDTRERLWKELGKTGIARPSLYLDVWKKSEESDVEPSTLMDLLVAFHLASPVPPSREHPAGSFFLPCVLDYYSPVPEFFQHGTKAASLYIVFELLEFVPPGFFTRLVTTLASYGSSQYKIDFSKGKVHRKRIIYSCAGSRKDMFTLMELPHAFKVDAIRIVEDRCRSFSSVCQELASALDECCKRVLSCYESHRKKTFINSKPAVEITWKFGLLCQSPHCGRHERGINHYCFFIPRDEPRFASLICEDYAPQQHGDQRYWFIEEEKSAASTSGSSTGCQKILSIKRLKDVKKELRAFSKRKWKDLGEELELDEEVLETVTANYEIKGVEECFREMLKHWLRQNYDDADSNPPTWSKLADAVKETGDPALADAIRRNHSS